MSVQRRFAEKQDALKRSSSDPLARVAESAYRRAPWGSDGSHPRASRHPPGAPLAQPSGMPGSLPNTDAELRMDMADVLPDLRGEDPTGLQAGIGRDVLDSAQGGAWAPDLKPEAPYQFSDNTVYSRRQSPDDAMDTSAGSWRRPGAEGQVRRKGASAVRPRRQRLSTLSAPSQSPLTSQAPSPADGSMCFTDAMSTSYGIAAAILIATILLVVPAVLPPLPAPPVALMALPVLILGVLLWLASNSAEGTAGAAHKLQIPAALARAYYEQESHTQLVTR